MNACPEGGVVLDPFAGSGTTLHTARRLGRRAIGIELNPEYARIAAERLQQLSLHNRLQESAPEFVASRYPEAAA